MAGRLTRGRQRIPMSRIQNQDDLYATFSKRRLGLYKKASELSTLCGVDLGIIIFSPTNNPYSFFSPNMESVVQRYRNPNLPQDAYSKAVESTTRARIDDLNRRLDEVLEEKQQLKEQLEEIEKTRPKGWWEETPIESLNKEQVKEWIQWFEAFKAQVDSRIQQLRNGGSGSSTLAPGPSSAPVMATGNINDQDATYQYGTVPDPSAQYFAPDPDPNTGSHYFLPQDPFYYPDPHPGEGPSGGGGSGGKNPASDQIFMSSYGGGSDLGLSQIFFPPPPPPPSDDIATHFIFSASSSQVVSVGGTSGPSFLPPPPLLLPPTDFSINPAAGHFVFSASSSQGQSSSSGAPTQSFRLPPRRYQRTLPEIQDPYTPAQGGEEEETPNQNTRRGNN